MKTEIIIEKLQGLPQRHKNIIIVVVAAVAAVGLLNVWSNSLQKEIGSISQADLLPEQTGKVLGASKHIGVEFLENKNDRTYLYFKVDNNTPSILTFSQLSNISFLIKGKTETPELIMNRQSSTFPAKMLSNQTTYGILVFNKVLSGEGILTFQNLYFETSPNDIFEEAVSIDLDKLKPLEELRQ